MMQADFVLDYDVLPPGRAHKLHLMARFVSGSAPQDQNRRPLNLSLVIDRSGSMAGEKIDYTRQAAQFLVQNLGIQDTLSVVLYNDHVETLLMPEKVRRKDIINQRIGAIKAAGTTNLSSGWLEGCTLVNNNLDENAVNRVILMSDGLANRGVTATDQLVAMAAQKLDEKISTTTMGLGNDFNEDLMMAMANAGGGAFYFIESPEVTPLIFQEELNGLLRVVGQNLTATLELTPHIRFVNQLNAYPQHSDGAQFTFRMGDVFGDEVKALLLEISLATIHEVGRIQIGKLRFEYDELDNGETRHHSVEMPVMLTISDQPQDHILEVNPEVGRSVLLLRAAQARRNAVQAADKGEFHTAAKVLRDAAHAIGESQIINPNLQEEQNALIQQAASMEKGDENYQYNRKTMATQAFYTMNSRHEDTVTLRGRENDRKSSPSDPKAPSSAINLDDVANVANAAAPPPINIARQPGVTPSHLTLQGQTIALTGDLIRIGRAKQNEIVLTVKGVSRFHCQIKRVADRLMLEDLGSTNGTLIASLQIKEPHALSVGDVVYVGDERLIFHDGSL